MEKKDAMHTKDRKSGDIVLAAIQCMRHFGAENVQVAQIAAQAGISTRTLNRYYPEKNILLSEAAYCYVLDKYAEFAASYRAADKAGLSGLERLCLFLRMQRNYCQTDLMDAMAFVDMNLFRLRHEALGDYRNDPRAGCIRVIVRDDLRRGIQDGSIRATLDEDRTAALISATYNGMMQRLTHVFQSDQPPEQKQRLFPIFDDYLAMLTGYLQA